MEAIEMTALVVALASLATNFIAPRLGKFVKQRISEDDTQNIILRNSEGETLKVSVSQDPKESEIVKLQEAINVLKHKSTHLGGH